jgi:epoxyqueuosine reductase
MRSSISKPRAAIAERARAEGFDAVGFARAEAPAGAAEGLDAFLARGFHGDMSWMQTTAGRRADPQALWPDARSVIILGLNYGPARDPLDALAARKKGAISVYAQGADYHDVIKKKLKRIGAWIAREWGAAVKIFVDTAPVMEKPLAKAAGLGWQGKHTNLVSREFGSWLFLGAIFTTLKLEPDAPGADACGSCRACLDVCPTHAFPAPYRLDARRCISYLTIEHKGHVAREFREAIGNRIYGCDDCLAVCPWNKFAETAREAAFTPCTDLISPPLSKLAALDDVAFRALFRKSPLKRIGRDRFVRNVLIAVGNSGAADLACVAEARLADESPLVRAMAVWALSRLMEPGEFARLSARHAPRETDPAVRKEWQAAFKAAPML